MIRVLLAALTAAFLLLSNSNAGLFMLPESTLPTCGGGNIEHIVATVTEGDKSLIFVKAVIGETIYFTDKLRGYNCTHDRSARLVPSL